MNLRLLTFVENASDIAMMRIEEKVSAVNSKIINISEDKTVLRKKGAIITGKIIKANIPTIRSINTIVITLVRETSLPFIT